MRHAPDREGRRVSARLAANQIFIHLPEYAKEVKKDLADGKATGFSDYAKLPGLLP